MPHVDIANAHLRVEIAPVGAEITSLRDGQGREWLWQGDASSWDRQAPVLFPVIGRVRGGAVRHAGRSYPMPSHGFAPTATFEVVWATRTACRLRLDDSVETWRSYPFRFRLEVEIAIADRTVVQRADVTNTGDEDLPFAIGFHPGFSWPLPTSASAPRERHAIRFEHDEPGGIRRMMEDGLGPPSHPSPVVERVLDLHDGLFALGALVLDAPASRRLWFGAPGHPGVLVETEELPHLGIWTRPPARFLCIEPWHGFADPAGFAGDLRDKPGSRRLAPGESSSHTIRCTLNEPMPAWAARAG